MKIINNLYTVSALVKAMEITAIYKVLAMWEHYTEWAIVPDTIVVSSSLYVFNWHKEFLKTLLVPLCIYTTFLASFRRSNYKFLIDKNVGYVHLNEK